MSDTWTTTQDKELTPLTNRQHKDRLFVRIFSDLEHKDWIISLVNALSGTHYTEDELVEVNTIEEILYIKMKNDVSYLIDHPLFLVEHQSSFNPNMPLRGLIYFGQLYDSCSSTPSSLPWSTNAASQGSPLTLL